MLNDYYGGYRWDLHFILAQATDPQLIDWLSRAGGFGILAVAVVAFLRGWIVPGSVAEQLRVERDRALELVYQQAEIAHRALEAAERKVL